MRLYAKLEDIKKHYDVQPNNQEMMPYIITGKRGATYGLMRNINNPSMMFAVSSKGKVSRLLPYNTEWVKE